MNTKGDISMNTIVAAIVALLILVILAAIIINNLVKVPETIANCPGMCKTPSGYANSCDDGKDSFTLNAAKSQGTCTDKAQVCCLPGGASSTQ